MAAAGAGFPSRDPAAALAQPHRHERLPALHQRHRSPALNNLPPLHILAGIGHFGILAASVQVPAILDWKNELARVRPFVRRLFWVYGVFIVFTIAGFGALSLANVDALAAGAPMSRHVALCIALFWAMRLAVQCFVFDARPYLTSGWRTLGYHTLTAAFLYFTAVYGWAAFH